jgi:hypothetical protein
MRKVPLAVSYALAMMAFDANAQSHQHKNPNTFIQHSQCLILKSTHPHLMNAGTESSGDQSAEKVNDEKRR